MQAAQFNPYFLFQSVLAIEIIMGEKEEFRRRSIKGDTVRGSNRNRTFTQESVVHVLVQESMVNYFKLRSATPVAVTLLWSLAADPFSCLGMRTCCIPTFKDGVKLLPVKVAH